MQSKQVIIVEPGRVELREVDIDEQLAPNQALVKACHSIISSGTEGATFTGLATRMPLVGHRTTYPSATGYGHVGEVLAVGEAVTMCRPGDVVLSFSGHASVVKADASRMALPVPAGMSTIHAAFARMAGVSIAALRSSSVEPGDQVLVLGLGLVGNFAAQLFQLAGADVIAVDVAPTRLEIARACGIRRAVLSSDVEEAVRDWTGGSGAVVTVEATGISEQAARGVMLTRRHGEVILLGSPRAEAVFDVTPMLLRAHLEAIRIVGSLEWTWPQHPVERGRHDITSNYRQLLGWLQTGRLVCDPLLSHLVSPASCQDVYEGLTSRRDEYVAAVFDWNQV